MKKINYYLVVYKSRITGMKWNGSPMSKESAISNARYANINFPDIIHTAMKSSIKNTLDNRRMRFKHAN